LIIKKQLTGGCFVPLVCFLVNEEAASVFSRRGGRLPVGFVIVPILEDL